VKYEGNKERGYQHTLSYSGQLAELFHHEGPPPQWVLRIGGTLHSSVNIDNPSDIYFYYAQKIVSIIEGIFPGNDRLSTLHLGAGALSLARYIEATRPGSPQVAVEIETDLLDFVNAVIPLSNEKDVELLTGDARDVVEKNIQRFANKFDLIIAEIYLDRTTPAHVTSLEFYSLLKSTLSTNGVLIVNVVDGGDYEFAPNQYVTLKKVFNNVKAVFDKEDLNSKAFTNILMIASDSSSVANIVDYSNLEPRPAIIVSGSMDQEWQQKGTTVTDLMAVDWTTITKHYKGKSK
jgi:hypothetical protein